VHVKRTDQDPDFITINLYPVDLVGLRAKVGARDIALGVLARTDDLKAVPRRIIKCIPRGWHRLLLAHSRRATDDKMAKI
jgi:hypothetical protein